MSTSNSFKTSPNIAQPALTATLQWQTVAAIAVFPYFYILFGVYQ
jgi:hypothetical protein